MKSSTNSQTITVKTNEDNPQPFEVIAESIIEVANAFEKINNSRLKQRAIIVLLKDMTGLAMKDIEMVLTASAKLKDWYIKQPFK